jgi:hypothetical protein
VTSIGKNCRDENFSSRLSFWLGLAIVTLAFIAGATLTWRRWPDLVIDFGPQLYMPWRIAEGAVLYRDLFYISGGPLSQYFHAALFKLFGVSFLTIIISNLAITAAMLAVIYAQFAKATNACNAAAITVAVTAIFAFTQYTGIGNNNYIAPYSHEMLHGLALSIFAVALLANWLESRNRTSAILAGLCFGLVLLTKPDIFVALSVATATAAILAFKLKLPRPLILKSAMSFVLSAIIPLLGFFLWFLRLGNWREGLRWEFFGGLPLFCRGITKNPYYQWSLGLDTPFDHLRQMSVRFLVAAVITGVCALLFRPIRKASPAKHWTFNVVVLGLLWFAATKFTWINCGMFLPLLCVATIGLLLHQFNKGNQSYAVIFPLIWSVFALLMLAKQGVFPRIWHTGFVLAMPAFICATFLFLKLLPDFLENRYQVPRLPMRIAALGVLTIACFSLVRTSVRIYSTKTLAVGHDADLIYARSPEAHSVEGKTFNLALDWLEKNTPPNATLATIPQGAMLNFLSRRANSSPCLDWNPTLFAFFGATNLTASLTNHPPDYIALVEWQTFEFGTGYFGTGGYGDDVMTWIHTNYQSVALFGSEPLQNGLFGVKILKWHPASVATNSVEKPIPYN